MPELSAKVQYQRQRLHIKAYGVLCFVLFLIMGLYSFNQWQEYSLIKEAVAQNNRFVNALRSQVAEEKAYYESEKPEFDELNKEIQQKLADIFPNSDNYTALVRQLDAFEEELHTLNDPFEVSNLDFQGISETEDYALLPLRMSIRSSAANFQKFLHLVESSGSLDNQVRLMDLSSIRLNFEPTSSDNRDFQIINFTVQINAYFQKVR